MPDRSPSIVPPEANQDTYLVKDDFGGRLGRAWRETDEEDTDRETLIRDLMDDQYGNPARIVAFNTAQGWSRDVTMDIADELRRRFAEYDEVPASVQEFLETARRSRFAILRPDVGEMRAAIVPVAGLGESEESEASRDEPSGGLIRVNRSRAASGKMKNPT